MTSSGGDGSKGGAAMTEVTSNAAPGTPNWIDLGIPDLRRAKEFYGALFGWEFEEGTEETGWYTMCLLRGRSVAAIMPHPDPKASEFWWNAYFATDDCDGTVKRITDAAGTVVMGPMDVMDAGRMAMVIDPAGAQFGLWQGRAHIGAGIINEPGSIAWTELETPDAKAAREFYATAFERPVEPMAEPGFDYSTINVGDRPVAGIWGAPEHGKSRWVTYFAVDDTDAAVRIATEAGGTVDKPAQDSPYGRFAVLKDPFGAVFSVIMLTDNLPT
jgi:predicted enzyme related to lactoylglutathione lyase